MILALRTEQFWIVGCVLMLRKSDANVRFYRSPGLDDVEFFHNDVNDHRYSLHTHDHHALAIILEGVFALRRGRRVEMLRPGAVVWVSAGEVHGGHRVGSSPCRYRMTYISDAFVSASIGNAEIAARPHYCERTFASLDALHRSCRTTEKETVKDRLGGVLRGLGEARGNRERCGVQRHPAIDRVIDLLLEGERDMGELADEIGLHPVTLSRVFRKAVGLPPHAFRLDRKVQEARSRIARGEGLADVAAELGFADQSHLTRHFKRRFGLTPGAYARQTRG